MDFAEQFHGFDQNDQMDEKSFEKFKERMARAAKQIQAIKKEEKKRKKKEDELVKILLKFIQSSEKKDLVLLISRTIEKNIPANFILSIVLLGNEDIQRAVGEFLMLKTADGAPITDVSADEKALIFFSEDKSMPLKVRIEIDNWIKGIIYQASESPYRLLDTAYDVKETQKTPEEIEKEEETSVFGEIKKTKLKKIVGLSLVNLMAHIIYDFLMQNGIEEDMVKLKEFSEFLIKGILTKTRDDISNQKKLS